MIFVNQILEKVDATCAFSWVCGQQLHPIDLHSKAKLYSVLRAIEWYKEHWNPLKICPTYWRRFQANQLDRRQLHGNITWGQSLLFGSLRLKSLANMTGNFSTWNRRTFSAGRISRSARQLQSFRPPFFIHFGVFIGSLALGYTKRKLVTTAPSDLTRQQPWQLEEQSKVWTQLASVPRTADEWQAEEWTRPTQSDGPLWPKMVTNFSLRNAKSHKSQKWRRRWRNEKKLNNFFFIIFGRAHYDTAPVAWRGHHQRLGWHKSQMSADWWCHPTGHCFGRSSDCRESHRSFICFGVHCVVSTFDCHFKWIQCWWNF